MNARLTASLAALLLTAMALTACTGGEGEDGTGEAATATATRTSVRPRPANPPAPVPTTPTPAGTPESAEVAADRAVLKTLYHATGGRDWHENKNWLANAPLDTWYGVTTDSNGRVTELILTVGLTGSIPPKLGSLTRLERLVLGSNVVPEGVPPHNYLSGPIPPELGMLARLKELVLSNNELSGPIPAELGALVYLEKLDLRENQLSGPIPAELGALAHLERLELWEKPAERAQSHRNWATSSTWNSWASAGTT